MASTSICRKYSTTSKQKTDIVNGQIYSNTFHDRYSRDPQVKLADLVLPLEKKPKVLGVTLDTNLTFTQHFNNIAVKVQESNNVLKALAGSTWSCDKETLQTTYKSIGRSIFSYYCPVQTPSFKETNWSRLQRA